MGIAIAALGLIAAGCSGIPHSSKPSTIESIGVEQPIGVQVQGPEPGADPRTIVQGFLNANGAQDPAHDGAYQFLTAQAKSHWDSSTVTVVDNEQVGVFSGNKVEVTGTVIGTINGTGIYTPALTGDGSGNGVPPQTFTYGVVPVDGQNRITTLPTGLLLSTAQFEAYRQYPIYFFDATEQHLVPDPRWSPQLDPASLAQFLIGQLALGPRDTLQADENTEFPQSDPTHVLVTTVSAGSNEGLTKIELPGASQVGKPTLNLLAAQIAHTLVPQVSTVNQMEITDGGVPVSIPAAHGPIFTTDEVTTPFVAAPNTAQLFYIAENGGVVNESGSELPGPIGKGFYGLESAAVTSSPGGGGLRVVATRKKFSLLDIGSVANNSSQMIPARLPAGLLSRPDWAPGGAEAWVGDGSRLYRVLPDGAASQIAFVEPSGVGTPRISAVRLSPEGSRVALVLTNADHSAQIWIGAVVRGSGDSVRVASLVPISPQGVDVLDVAWNDELKLFAVGQGANNGPAGVYEVQVDGSLWTADGFANLPAPPDNITASQGFVAAVSSGGSIWKQSGATWVSPNGPGQDARGTDPIYST